MPPYRSRRRSAHQEQGYVVERAVQVEGGGQGLAPHPEHREAAIVGHQHAAADEIDELG
jgi:hypothetical protein